MQPLASLLLPPLLVFFNILGLGFVNKHVRVEFDRVPPVATMTLCTDEFPKFAESFKVDCKLTGSNDEDDDDLPFVGVTFVTVAIVVVASTWVAAFSIGIIVSVAIVVDEVSRLHIMLLAFFFAISLC